jgi:formate dehydrogenase subunit delta
MSTHTGNGQLIKMANQIESFFRSDPDRDAAIAGIENHIRKFWEPRMRNAIIAHVEAGGAGVGELAVAAIHKIAQSRPVAT